MLITFRHDGFLSTSLCRLFLEYLHFEAFKLLLFFFTDAQPKEVSFFFHFSIDFAGLNCSF